MLRSHPTRVRELKRLNCVLFQASNQSHPTRVRELKHNL